MTVYNSGQKKYAIHTSNSNESTIEQEESATENLIQNNERIFRKSIEIIKSGSFTVGRIQEDVLKRILRLLVNHDTDRQDEGTLYILKEYFLIDLIYTAFIYTFISTQTYCVSILAVLGMLQVVVDRAREAKREGKEYGGSFMIYGESEIEQEYNETILRRKVELMSNYRLSLESIEEDDLQIVEIENQKHKEAENKNLRQMAQLKQEIKTKEQSDENAIQKLSEISSEQQIKQDRVKDQEICEKLINMSDQVSETDKLVEIRRHEIDSLEQGCMKKYENFQSAIGFREIRGKFRRDYQIVSIKISAKPKQIRGNRAISADFHATLS
ncbi:MAG: hypothetical protein EZS28_013408 [Streblomastix strix]|uniref:Uncharacterized protein n=1 Tax=Streblomastix strix TaxID=222440 RepID=A0A5J4W865_9EUKA|nr:MAG: hypothetical protein EZS28_013408 [Streblomastix strix]